MFSLFASLIRLLPATAPAEYREGVAQQLMHSAEARAGTNPRQAQELRDAACAYLSVVR
jgi:hypothetical protein